MKNKTWYIIIFLTKSSNFSWNIYVHRVTTTVDGVEATEEVTAESLTLSDLQPESSYDVTVAAIDADGATTRPVTVSTSTDPESGWWL